MVFRRIAWILVLGIFPWSGRALGAENTVYSRQRNIVYEVKDGVGLILDVFKPTSGKNGLGLIDTLSGSWYSEHGQLKDHLKAGVFDTFCSHGYTVFMIRPGSRTKYTAEEMVANLKTGIRWVKEHAGEYAIDPERLGIMGASAGGHLTLLTVVTPEEGRPDAGDPLLQHDTHVKAVAVFFPPTDFLDWGGDKHAYGRLGDLFFKCGLQGHTEKEIEAKAEAVSPALQVKATPPPMLIIHGDADPTVPLQQSRLMVDTVKKAGGSAELIVKKGGGHPWPTIYEEVETMARWFDKRLKAE